MCKEGSPSKRGKPPNPPKWAVEDENITDEGENIAPEETPAIPETPTEATDERETESDSWMYEVTGVAK